MKKLLDACSLFMAVTGSCAAVMVCYILFIYPNLSDKNLPDNKDTTLSSQNIVRTPEDVLNHFNQNEISPQFDDAEMETASPETVYNTNSVPFETYNIGDIEFLFSDSVINDATGKYRISSIASSKDITEYASDYYNTLFSSDDEIHAIVNSSLNTTTSISVLPDGLLDVVIHEYFDGEEHDAKNLFAGIPLKEYFVNPQTGEFEEILASSNIPIEQNEPNVIYSYDIPVENSNQATNNFVSAESRDNFNTYDNPVQQQTADSYVSDNTTAPNEDIQDSYENNFDTNNMSDSQVATPVGDTVWLSATGSHYHSIDHCGRMNPDKARQVSLDYAISEGYGRCEKCFPN